MLSRRSSDITQMARDFGALVGAHDDDAGIAFESSGSLLLLGMIIMSPSIISIVIFPCGHDDNESGRFSRRSDIAGHLGGGTSKMAHGGRFCGGRRRNGGMAGGGGNGCGGGGMGGADAETDRSGPQNTLSIAFAIHICGCG